MKHFQHNGKLYLKVTPVKSLFKSTMVHEVVTRGDMFAVCLETAELTIIPAARSPTPEELRELMLLRAQIKESRAMYGENLNLW